MSAFTDYTETAVLNHIFKATEFSLPSNLYVALFTGAPGETASPSDECTYTGYARVDAAGGDTLTSGWTSVADADTGAGKQVTNAKAVTFAANQDAEAEVVTHLGIFDALTSGNMLVWSALATPKTLSTGDVLSFAIGAIKVALD